MAHSHLVTPDICVTTFSFITSPYCTCVAVPLRVSQSARLVGWRGARVGATLEIHGDFDAAGRRRARRAVARERTARPLARLRHLGRRDGRGLARGLPLRSHAVFSRDRLSTGARGRRGSGVSLRADRQPWVVVLLCRGVRREDADSAARAAGCIGRAPRPASGDARRRQFPPPTEPGRARLLQRHEHQESDWPSHILPIYPLRDRPGRGRAATVAATKRAGPNPWSGSRSPGAPFHHSWAYPHYLA